MATSPVTIGIDARAATEVRAGRGRVVRELLRALSAAPGDHRYVCYTRRQWSEPLDARFAWRLIDAPDPLWHVRATRQAARECDVLLASNSYLTVLLTRMSVVAIVYDLVAFDRALSPNRRSQIIERLTLGATVHRARGLLCISQFTANELCSRFPVARPKVTVATLGISPALAAPSDPIDTDNAELPPPGFVLAVGTMEPRKNLPRLVEAYACLDPALQQAHPLVVVGALGWSAGPTVAALRSLGDRAHVLGHISDAALAELYRRCAVFCYPSLGEGFGLPVLEAMAAGAAVITSSVSSLPEVGGDAVAYVVPDDVADITRGLKRVLRDPAERAAMEQRGRARAARFTWADFAQRTLQAVIAAAQTRAS
jgi:glycosyltransferase involved in cell wall biosynthesis